MVEPGPPSTRVAPPPKVSIPRTPTLPTITEVPAQTYVGFTALKPSEWFGTGLYEKYQPSELIFKIPPQVKSVEKISFGENRFAGKKYIGPAGTHRSMAFAPIAFLLLCPCRHGIG